VSPRPDRVLLVRSGRHLRVALDVLGITYPGCEIFVLATQGTEHALDQAGVPDDHCLIYDAAPVFDWWPLLRSGVYRQARRLAYDHVAVLWIDPSGGDRANVDRTAMLLSPRGFDAITPDGTLIARPTSALVCRALIRTAVSIPTAVILGVALFVPALVGQLLSRIRPPSVTEAS